MRINLKNIYKEIKINTDKISEAKDTLKDEMDMLKQSVENIEQITGDYEMYQGILGCNSLLLLIILVLLISLTVTMIQMQAKLETISNDHENNKASKQINHKDGAAELRSNNQHKTNKNSQTDNLKNLWLSKYDEQTRNEYLPVILKMTDFTEKRKNKESWYSDPFFVSKDGCEMCL